MMRFIKDVNAEWEAYFAQFNPLGISIRCGIVEWRRVEFGILVRPDGRKGNLYKLMINDKVISY